MAWGYWETRDGDIGILHTFYTPSPPPAPPRPPAQTRDSGAIAQAPRGELAAAHLRRCCRRTPCTYPCHCFHRYVVTYAHASRARHTHSYNLFVLSAAVCVACAASAGRSCDDAAKAGERAASMLHATATARSRPNDPLNAMLRSRLCAILRWYAVT